jgi:GTP-binding protein
VKVKQARFVLSAVRHQDLVTDSRPQIAFVGRSNVGKSSLLNRLVGRKALAKISSSPGKTRAVNYFDIEPRPRVIQLVDAKVGATPLDVQAIEYLRSQGCEPSVVATKIDRLPRSKRQRQLAAISQILDLGEDNGPTPCSSKSGEGVKEIWKGIYAFLRESAEMVN